MVAEPDVRPTGVMYESWYDAMQFGAMPALPLRPSRGAGSGAVSRRYLLAHFGKSQLWHASTLLFSFFLTETADLPPMTMGWILGGSLVLNGITDLMVGRILGTRVGNGSAAIALQARASPIVAAFFVLFACTPMMPPGDRAGWALVMLVGFRVSYPLVDVAQNALVATFVAGPSAQRRLLAGRNMASALADLSVSTFAAPLLIAGRPMAFYLAWSTAVAGFAWWTAHLLTMLPRSDVCKSPGQVPRTGADARIPGRALIVVALMVTIAAGATFRTMEPFYAAYASRSIGLLVCASIAAFFSQPLWHALIGRFGAAMTFIVAAATLLFAASVLGSSWRLGSVGVLVAGSGYGVGSSGLWLLIWSFMMRHVDPSRPMRLIGAFTCASKLAQASAMLTLGFVLAHSPYRTALLNAGSTPSRLMIAALLTMTLTCAVLAAATRRLTQTGRDETPAMPRRSTLPALAPPPLR